MYFIHVGVAILVGSALGSHARLGDTKELREGLYMLLYNNKHTNEQENISLHEESACNQDAGESAAGGGATLSCTVV